jgi:hypothetical protein
MSAPFFLVSADKIVIQIRIIIVIAEVLIEVVSSAVALRFSWLIDRVNTCSFLALVSSNETATNATAFGIARSPRFPSFARRG